MNLRSVLLSVLSLSFLLLVYQFATTSSNTSFFPSISEIATEVIKIVNSGVFFNHARFTFQRVIISLSLSFFLSIILGFLIGQNRNIKTFFDLPLTVSLVIPGFVWAILTLIWFGISEVSIVAAVVLTSTPLMIITFVEGVKNLDISLFEVGKVYQIPLLKRVFYITLPQLFPQILSMLRLGLSVSWKLVVIAELFGISNGVGYQINVAYHNYRSEKIFAWILSFGFIMLVIEKFIFRPLESRLTVWRNSKKT